MLELEGLGSGVAGKLGLWDALAQIAALDERLDEEEIAGLQAKAERQLEGLREQHRMAAREAFVQA